MPCLDEVRCYAAVQAYLGGIEAQALEGLQKGLDGVIAGGKHAIRLGPVPLCALIDVIRSWPMLLQV